METACAALAVGGTGEGAHLCEEGRQSVEKQGKEKLRRRPMGNRCGRSCFVFFGVVWFSFSVSFGVDAPLRSASFRVSGSFLLSLCRRWPGSSFVSVLFRSLCYLSKLKKHTDSHTHTRARRGGGGGEGRRRNSAAYAFVVRAHALLDLVDQSGLEGAQQQHALHVPIPRARHLQALDINDGRPGPLVRAVHD
jgi:hypothetical protein